MELEPPLTGSSRRETDFLLAAAEVMGRTQVQRRQHGFLHDGAVLDLAVLQRCRQAGPETSKVLCRQVS